MTFIIIMIMFTNFINIFITISIYNLALKLDTRLLCVPCDIKRDLIWNSLLYIVGIKPCIVYCTVCWTRLMCLIVMSNIVSSCICYWVKSYQPSLLDYYFIRIYFTLPIRYLGMASIVYVFVCWTVSVRVQY